MISPVDPFNVGFKDAWKYADVMLDSFQDDGMARHIHGPKYAFSLPEDRETATYRKLRIDTAFELLIKLRDSTSRSFILTIDGVIVGFTHWSGCTPLVGASPIHFFATKLIAAAQKVVRFFMFMFDRKWPVSDPRSQAPHLTMEKRVEEKTGISRQNSARCSLMCIRKRLWGQGYGHVLFSAGLHAAEADAAPSARFIALNATVGGRPLYEKSGLRVADEERMTFDDKSEHCLYFMYKVLRGHSAAA